VEGGGFELPVPGERDFGFEPCPHLIFSNCLRVLPKDRPRQGPKVRIHLPPAVSPANFDVVRAGDGYPQIGRGISTVEIPGGRSRCCSSGSRLPSSVSTYRATARFPECSMSNSGFPARPWRRENPQAAPAAGPGQKVVKGDRTSRLQGEAMPFPLRRCSWTPSNPCRPCHRPAAFRRRPWVPACRPPCLL
jgi:hypothetical protein